MKSLVEKTHATVEYHCG